MNELNAIVSEVKTNIPPTGLAGLAASLVKEKVNAPVTTTTTAEDEKAKTEAAANPELPAQLKSELETGSSDKEKDKLKTEAAKDKGKEKKEAKGKEEDKNKEEKTSFVDKDGKEIKSFSEDETNSFLKEIGVEETEVEDSGKSKITKEKGKPAKAEVKAGIPKEVEQELAELRDLKKLTTSDEFKLISKVISDFRKSGEKDPKKILKQFDSPDYDKMSHVDIYKTDLESQGLEGEELKEAIEEFESLPTYKQKLITNPIKSQLKKSSDEKVRTLLSEPSEEDNKEVKIAINKASKEGVGKLDEMIDKTSAKGYFGYMPSEEELEEVRNEVMSVKPETADGKNYSYPVVKAFHQAMRNNEKIFKNMLTKAYDIGYYKGTDDFVKERNRINKNDFTSGSAGASGGNKSFENTYMKSKRVVSQSN